ncbi:MAG: bifunctional hydroxymethylpyrimidine kinase/phosphomethylpyrimidine kinase [Bacillota bacterium]|jgi:hydroxymethylpyrimidine/phosphomethylpyrimidine kinase
MKTVLTIAGSDCSGGAGIQADLKTFTVHKVYGMSVITAITVQNTLGVQEVFDLPKRLVEKQIDSIFTDIFPQAIKIGMVSSEPIINSISQKLQEYSASNIVIDPVMISTSGCPLLSPSASTALINCLLPQADIITPNIAEAEMISGQLIKDKKDMLKAALALSDRYPGYILIKGGHLSDCSDDLLVYQNEVFWLQKKRLQSHNTHGTGCTLSAAIAANLALGLNMVQAVKNAKEFVFGAIKKAADLGKGQGPLNHSWCI